MARSDIQLLLGGRKASRTMLYMMKFMGVVFVALSFFHSKRAIREIAAAQQAGGESISGRLMLTGTACVIGFSIGGGLLAYQYVPPSGPFLNPHLKTEAFVWPEGCPRKPYAQTYFHVKSEKRVPRACFPTRNLFTDWRKYGFHSFGYKRAAQYYRLGNDAVEVSCPDSILSNETDCLVGNAVLDVFHQ